MSERFPLIPKNRLPAPGHCVGCGSIDRDCVDIGLKKDFWGVVLLCNLCYVDMGTSFIEAVDPELENLRNKVAFYEAKFGELHGVFNRELDSFFSALNRYAVAGGPTGFSGPVPDTSSKPKGKSRNPKEMAPEPVGVAAENFTGFFEQE